MRTGSAFHSLSILEQTCKKSLPDLLISGCSAALFEPTLLGEQTQLTAIRVKTESKRMEPPSIEREHYSEEFLFLFPVSPLTCPFFTPESSPIELVPPLKSSLARSRTTPGRRPTGMQVYFCDPQSPWHLCRLFHFTRTENLKRRFCSQSAAVPDCETPAASPSNETARTFPRCRSA